MTNITIDLVTPKGIVLEKTDIPAEYTVHQIIEELVDHLQLPYFAAERKINYSLKWVNQNLILESNQTLVDAGVSEGDQLQLISSDPVDEIVDPKKPGIAEANNSDRTVEVVLSVLDSNKITSETFDTDCRIEDLIKIIGKKYRLPEFDTIHVPTTYYMKSKALGRVLNGAETLRSAGVPRLDRLAVLRTEIAG